MSKEREQAGTACRCGEPSDGWPDGDDGELCQECWEADCDASWWEMMAMIGTGGDRG